jgi:hypothetical protein
MTSLEGWGSTIELRPRRSDHQAVAYRLPEADRSWPGRRWNDVAHSSAESEEPALVETGLLKVGRGRLRMANGMWRSLVSAPALGAGGPRFESGHPDQKCRSWTCSGLPGRVSRSSDRQIERRPAVLSITDWISRHAGWACRWIGLNRFGPRGRVACFISSREVDTVTAGRRLAR